VARLSGCRLWPGNGPNVRQRFSNPQEGPPQEVGLASRRGLVNESGILYHYTTAAGIIGIVQSQTLWATDAEFFNDARELQFGRQQVHDALLKRADELSPRDSDAERSSAEEGDAFWRNDSRATVMRSAAGHLFPGGPYGRQQYHFVYVACFCEEGDLLSQWRGYGAPGGYAVGFRASQLRLVRPAEIGTRNRESGLTDETAALVQVQYGGEAVDKAVTKVLRDVAPQPVGFPGVRGYDRTQSVVLPTLAGIKDNAFSEEQEWRLVLVTDQHSPSFRTGPLGVTPCISLRYPREAIAEVVVGPGPEQPLREKSVGQLVGEGVVVRSSKAPFRG
jgi:hypothetical protein